MQAVKRDLGDARWVLLAVLIGLPAGLMDAAVPAGRAKAAGPVGPATYYLDADAGDDSKAGTSSQTAWKSLARTRGIVNGAHLARTGGPSAMRA